MHNLIESLDKAIDIEYDSKNEELSELKLLSIEDRVQKGDSIDNVTAHFEKLNLSFSNIPNSIAFSTVTISCAKNISKFREGNPVVLSGHGQSFKLEIIEDNGEQMTLYEDYYIHSLPEELNHTSGWQINPANVDIRNIVKKSTSHLASNTHKFNRISGILNGSITPNYIAERKHSALKIIEGSNLNEKQKEAFINAYSTDSYYLIQGPPGSGKTKVLAHLAKAFAQEGKKVLISASTHTAINNALQKVSIIASNLDVIKVGKKNQRENLNENGSTAKNIVDFARSGYTNESKGLIVGATCYSPHTKKLEFMNWDVVIIDEAGQLGIPLAVAAMVKAEKYIFIGDHMQLPPIIPGKNVDPTFSRSIFEHLFQFSSGTMLNVTYRMNSAINRFPSHQFYSGELLPHSSNSDQLLSIDNTFLKHQEVLDINFPEVLYCHNEPSISSRSEFEADLTAEFVKEYLDKGVNPNEIAVITPFRAQVRQIKKALATLDLNEEVRSQIFVDTIERIQGQEKDVIIYSLATSNPEQAKQRASFFFNPNRLNVALTRSKKKRIVIANKDIFKIHSEDTATNKLIDVFRSYYQDAYKVEDKVSNNVEMDYQF